MRDYLFLWQLPVIAALLLGWLLVGGYVLWRVFRKQTGSRKVPYGKFVLYVFLVVAGGGFAGGAVGALISTIGNVTKTSLDLLAVGVGALALAGMAFLILRAALELPDRQVLICWTWLMGALVTIGAVLGTPAAYVTLNQHATIVFRRACGANLEAIAAQISIRYGQSGQPPRDLRELVEKGYLARMRWIRCPGNRDLDVGFFYAIEPILLPSKTTSQVRACDYSKAEHGGRNVLYINGRVEWFSEQEFWILMDRPENQAFAKLLRAAEEKLPAERAKGMYTR